MIGAMPLRFFSIFSGSAPKGRFPLWKNGSRILGKDLVCLALLFAVLLCPAAFAASEGISGLAERYENGEAMELRAEAVLHKVPGMNDALLEKVNGWLGRSGAVVRAQRGNGGDREYALLTFDGIDVLEAQTIRTGDAAITVFPGSGRAYRTRGGGFSFLENMTGDASLPMLSPDWEQAFMFRLVPGFYEIVSGGAEEITEETANVRVKNIGTSPMQTVYVLSADGANALRPGMTTFFAAGSSALLAYRTMAAENAAMSLRDLVFTGAVTVTRLYDADGRDMGIKVAGRCSPGDGSERKLTLTCGFQQGSALYFSLSMPSVRGKLSDRWELSAVRKATSSRVTYTLEGRVSRTDNRGTVSLDLDGSVKETLGEKSEISGKVTLSGRIYGIRKGWTVRPEIACGENGAAGNVRLTESTAGETDTDLTVLLSLAPCGDIVIADHSGETDMTSLGEEERETLLAREAMPLLRVWLYRMEALTYEERESLAHILRNGNWMNGPVTADPPEARTPVVQDNEWSVEEGS
ncbi:MAG: hypothetical protein IKP22_06030 [Clostridia bacterium]|nr:hypothetical protein [Clostridia bacterium]